MPNDKEKLLRVMRSLDMDYKEGKISEEKYKYFRSKYEDKLSIVDAWDATNRIRSMQGKKSGEEKPNKSNLLNKKKKEEKDLVQKYIINPKKGDKDSHKKEKVPMDNSTFKLVAVLVLVIGFTAGIGFGVLTFDFGNISTTANAQAIVQDTAFPEVNEVAVTTNESNASVSTGETYTSDTYSTDDSQDTQQSTTSDYSSSSSSSSGSSSSGSSSSGSSSSGSSSSGSSSSGSSSSGSSSSDSGSGSSESSGSENGEQ